MLITLAMAIILSQQNTRIIMIITLFYYVIISDVEGALTILSSEKKKLVLTRSHTFSCVRRILEIIRRGRRVGRGKRKENKVELN